MSIHFFQIGSFLILSLEAWEPGVPARELPPASSSSHPRDCGALDRWFVRPQRSPSTQGRRRRNRRQAPRSASPRRHRIREPSSMLQSLDHLHQEHDVNRLDRAKRRDREQALDPWVRDYVMRSVAGGPAIESEVGANGLDVSDRPILAWTSPNRRQSLEHAGHRPTISRPASIVDSIPTDSRGRRSVAQHHPAAAHSFHLPARADGSEDIRLRQRARSGRRP